MSLFLKVGVGVSIVVVAELFAFLPVRAAEVSKAADCQVYRGSSYGNTVARVRLRICGPASAIKGTVAMVSRSGSRVHYVRGRWKGDRLWMTDVRLSQKPRDPRMRFCLVERWDLRRSDSGLSGTFDSKKCSDHAEVRLELRR